MEKTIIFMGSIFLFFVAGCHSDAVSVKSELYRIAAGKEGIEKNYLKARSQSEKASKIYFKGPKEEKAFADAQARLIVAAAKFGKTEEAQEVYHAADRGGVANESVYLARDLAKKIAEEQNKKWFGLSVKSKD